MVDRSSTGSRPARIWRGHPNRGQPKADRTASNLSIEYSPDASGKLPERAFFKYNMNGRDRVAVRRHCAAVREALFYDEINRGLDDPIGPEAYDIGGDYDDGVAYLIIEDIADDHYLVDKADVDSPWGGWAPFETVPAERFVETTRRLARFQAAWWNHARITEPDLSSSTGDMLSVPMTGTETFVEKTLTDEWEDNIVEGLEKRGEPDPSASRETMRAAIEAWPDIWKDRASQGNLSLMHVDMHLRNVLFRKTDDRPILIDWEGLTTRLGIIDIAHLIATSMLSPDYLSRLDGLLVPAYHEALIEGGVTGYSLEDCERDYRLAWLALRRDLMNTR
ncbi:MAG: hypothetical protein CME19_14545 [Gemmatimonadetes bacterium]|nr:hypothetical protein [Gemmatimonadota bacterium]